jgi:hypothetical protein
MIWVELVTDNQDNYSIYLHFIQTDSGAVLLGVEK